MASCKYPIKVKQKRLVSDDYSYIKVPCGRCMNCKQGRGREWIFRLKQEMKVSTSAFFVTLTYDDGNIVCTEQGTPTLWKYDLWKYFKEVRRSMEEKLRYFACGEYGTKTKRPHYHAIIFNAEKDTIEEKWNKGIVHVGEVTEDSIAYTTKYVLKQNEEWEKYKVEKDPGFHRQFNCMSKGIGKNYFEDPQVIKYHKENLDKPWLEDEKGFKYPIPRYYKKNIFNDDEIKVVNKHTAAFMEGLERDSHKEAIAAEREGRNRYKEEVEHNEWKDYIFEKRVNQKTEKL